MATLLWQLATSQPPINYLGTFNSQGLPNYLEAVDEVVTQAFIDRISAAVPENMPVPDYHPSYLNNDYSADIILVEEADVYISFVLEGAGYRNVLGFYDYQTDNPPQTVADIDSITIIFPNVSRLNSGGELLPGNRVNIGHFDAGTTIGFVVFANGFNASTGQVTYGRWQHYSDKRFNPPADTAYRQHSIVLYDAITERHVISFEDITRPSGDRDFNDAVFFGTTDPPNAALTARAPGLPLVWEGTVSSQWDNPYNWNPNYVPDSSSAVTISSKAVNPPYIDEDLVVNELVVEPGANITSSPEAKLKVNGDYTSNTNISANLNFVGETHQTIYGDGTINDMTLSSVNQVIVAGNLEVEGNLVINSGELVTNDQLTLTSSSDANGMLLNEGGSINGRITFKRVIPNKDGYHYLSSPIQGATLRDISDDVILKSLGGNLYSSPFPNVFYYDETVPSIDNTQGWKVPGSVDYNLLPGRGIAVNMPGNTEVDFTGVPNDGDIDIPLTNTFSEVLPVDWDRCPPDGWNLIGNPYPTAIDWDLVQKTDSFQAGMHRWNPFVNQYATYINGVSTNGGSSRIASFQGFFVLTSTSDTLHLKNEHRVLDTAKKTMFFRKQDRNVFNFTFGNEALSDEIAIYLDDRATHTFSPKLDLFKMLPSDANTPYCYFSGSEYGFAIRAVNPYSTGVMRAKITVYQPNAGLAIFKAVSLEWKEYGLYPYLVDHHTDRKIDLAAQDYMVNLPKGIDSTRFSIEFESFVVGVDNGGSKKEEDGWANYDGETLNFVIPNKGNYRIIDDNGRSVYAGEVSDTASIHTIKVHLHTGFYILDHGLGAQRGHVKFLVIR